MSVQVFISYAHADNEALDADCKGWVTEFVDKLQKAIAMKPGGSQVKCWMDHHLEPHRVVDAALRQRVQESQCIVAFMSPRYLESDWCQKEMALFIDLVGGGNADNRVFLVELLPTEREAWHVGHQHITAIPFWESGIDQPEPMTLGWPLPNPKADKPYWRELNNLASILARQIQNLPPLPPVETTAVASTTTPTSIAPTTPPAAPPPKTAPLSVVVNADKPDRALAEQVQALLDGLEVDATLVAEQMPDQLPAEYFQHLDTLLESNHGVLIVYGATQPSWVQVQHARARKVLAQCRSGIWGGLLDGPPEPKPDHGIKSRNLMLLDCRRGLSTESLQQFVAALRQGAGHV